MDLTTDSPLGVEHKNLELMNMIKPILTSNTNPLEISQLHRFVWFGMALSFPGPMWLMSAWETYQTLRFPQADPLDNSQF